MRLGSEGSSLGRRRYIESLLSPLSRRGRKPAINNVVHYLVGILLVDIRDLLAFLVCHGDRGITRAFELGRAAAHLPQKVMNRKNRNSSPSFFQCVLPFSSSTGANFWRERPQPHHPAGPRG